MSEKIKGLRKLIAAVSAVVFGIFYVAVWIFKPEVTELMSFAMMVLSAPLGYMGINLVKAKIDK